MKLKSLLIFLILTVNVFFVCGQYTDRYWCFGDSAAIDFNNLINPIPGHSMLESRGTCASICDSTGALLFYAGDPHVSRWLNASAGLRYGYVVNKNHQLMQNGDSLVGETWYQEMTIVPDPNNQYRYYLFCAGETSPNNGLFYSVIDLSYNNGLGKVTQKNIQIRNDTLTDGITAVKHGNGRDWWIVVKNYTQSPQTTNSVYVYLVSPIGVIAQPIQNIGTAISDNGFLRLKFNKEGTSVKIVKYTN